jgi:hypothetical protein
MMREKTCRNLTIHAEKSCSQSKYPDIRSADDRTIPSLEFVIHRPSYRCGCLAGWIAPERHFEHPALVRRQAKWFTFLIAIDDLIY